MINGLCIKISDWDEFLFLVDRHRIPALAYANLARFSDIIPVKIMEAMKKRSQDAKLHSLRLAAEFSRLTRLLEQHGISSIPLKGQMLSHQLYGDPAIRQTRDIDLLIRPLDLEKTGKLLQAEGYRLSETDANLTHSQTRFVLSALQHHEYHHRQRGIELELHWRCTLWNDDDMQSLWDSSDTTKFGGLDLRVISEDLQLLYLCDHGSLHKWFRLKWLGDLARIISSNGISSWDRVVALAERMGLQRGLGQCAVLVEQLYNIPLPDAFSQLAHEKISVRLACDALEIMKKSDAYINTMGGRGEGVRRLFYYKRLRPSLPVTTLLRSTLVSTADYGLIRLPDRLFWMYIPLRPVLWFWRNYIGKWIKKGQR